MAKIEIDLTEYDRIKEQGDSLKSIYAERNANFKAFEDMYLMDWTEPRKPGVTLSKTISPDARNAIHGAVRLMVATDPLFNVAVDKQARTDATEKIERAASYIWMQASRVYGSPVHYDAILSSLLYGEQHIAITDTSEMVEHAKQVKRSKAFVARAEKIAATTPFTFDIWNPKDAYIERDNYGLTAYLLVKKVKAGEIRSRFGDAAYSVLESKAPADEVELKIWYDLEWYMVSIDDTPVICRPHDLISIPIIATLADGTRLFGKPEHQSQPFLYTLYKSGMWQRQNLSLTVLYTLIEQIGMMPTFIHRQPQNRQGNEPKSVEVDHSLLGGMIDLEYSEELTMLDKSRIIDPSLKMGMDVAEAKANESTMYKVALGQPLSSGTAFSSYSLLAQSGRVPLISVQKRGGWGIAEAVELALRFYKDGGKKHQALDLTPSEIPDTLQLDARLDIALPQDKLQMANIAQMLVNSGLATREWARENVLNINQSRQMDDDIWAERAADTQYMAWLQQQQQQAAMSTQPQQPMMPPGGAETQMIPPEMQAGAMMPGGQGEMVQGGLPPQMAGMLPGQGEAAVPPEMAGMMGGD